MKVVAVNDGGRSRKDLGETSLVVQREQKWEVMGRQT